MWSGYGLIMKILSMQTAKKEHILMEQESIITRFITVIIKVSSFICTAFVGVYVGIASRKLLYWIALNHKLFRSTIGERILFVTVFFEIGLK